MIRFTLRRNRIQLPIWILSIALMWAVSAGSISHEFGSNAAHRRQLTEAILLNPSIIAVRGLPDGDSLAALVYFQVFGFVAMLAGLMATFLATRGVRGDEDRGRQELLLGAPVPRSAPITATLVVGVVAELLAGLLSAAALLGLGFPAAGSWVVGAAVAGVGICFLGIGLLIGQLMPSSRSANTTGAVVVVLAYALRAIGDALGTGDLTSLTVTAAWPSWTTPLGWAEQLSPYHHIRLWPLLLILALAAVATAGAYALQSRRDLGASLVPERAGRPVAPAWLRGATTLLLRQNRAALVLWVIAGVFFGALAGSLSGALTQAVGATEGVGSILQSLAPGQDSGLTNAFVGTIASMAGVVAAAAALQTLLRMRGEETDGRTELLRAAPFGRIAWLVGPLVLALVSGAAVMVVTGLVGGLSFLGAGHPSRFGSTFLSGVAQLPSVVLFVGVAALALALLPRAATGIAWGVMAVGYVIGMLGGILKLPRWLRDVSPITHTPVVPGPHPDWGPAMIVLAVGLALCVVALAAMRRRELTP